MKDQDIDEFNSRNMMVVCEKCGASNQLKQQGKQLKYRCGSCKSDIPNPLYPTNEAEDRGCRECSKKLTDEPAILIDGNCYCFLHAKLFFPKILALHKKQEKDANSNFEELSSSFKNKKAAEESALRAWHYKRSEHSRNNGFTNWKWAWYLVTVIGLVSLNPGLGILAAIPCLLAVPFIDEWFQGQRNLQFDTESPRPTCDTNLSPPVYKPLPRPAISTHPGNHDPASVNIGYNRGIILQRDEYRCQNCGKIFQPELLEVHHVDPLAKGGCDSPRNLTTLCLKCHLNEDWFGHVHKMRDSFGLKPGSSKRKRF
jgi:transposase-like protein